MADSVCANPRCDQIVVRKPRRNGGFPYQLYCSRACSARAHTQKYRARLTTEEKKAISAKRYADGGKERAWAWKHHKHGHVLEAQWRSRGIDMDLKRHRLCALSRAEASGCYRASAEIPAAKFA